MLLILVCFLALLGALGVGKIGYGDQCVFLTTDRFL